MASIKVYASKSIASEYGSFKEGQHIPHGRGQHQVPTTKVTNWVKCGSAVVRHHSDNPDEEDEEMPLLDADGNETISSEDLSKLLSQSEEYDQTVNDADEEAELAALSGQVVAGTDGTADGTTEKTTDESGDTGKTPEAQRPKNLTPKPVAKPIPRTAQ